MNYAIEENAQRQIELQLLHVDKEFSRNSIDQLDVAAECQSIFSLTNGEFRIHRIYDHRFEYMKSLVKQNASLFAWNPKRSFNSADLIIRICIVIGQQVKFWDCILNQGRSNPYRESIKLDSTAKSIAWYKNNICVASEIGYTIYDVNVFFYLAYEVKILE